METENPESPGKQVLILLLFALTIAIFAVAIFFMALNKFNPNIVKGISGIAGALWVMITVKILRERL